MLMWFANCKIFGIMEQMVQIKYILLHSNIILSMIFRAFYHHNQCLTLADAQVLARSYRVWAPERKQQHQREVSLIKRIFWKLHTEPLNYFVFIMLCYFPCNVQWFFRFSVCVWRSYVTAKDSNELSLSLQAFFAGPTSFSHPALIHKNNIQFAVYRPAWLQVNAALLILCLPTLPLFDNLSTSSFKTRSSFYQMFKLLEQQSTIIVFFC